MPRSVRTACRSSAKVPRCPLGRSLFYHIFYRDFVVRPAFPIAEVFVGKLPAFERIIYSVLEPANLLASRDVQKNLRYADAVLDQQTFELVDFFVTSPPLALRGKSLHALDQNSPVPGTVKHHDLTVLRKFLPESLEVMFPSLMRRWCRNGVHLETTRIQNPSKASNDAALSGRIPSFEHDNSALLRAEIGLLDSLQS
jgi:hypothetical protein